MSLYSPNEVMNDSPQKTLTIRERIKTVVLIEECWEEMEPMLMGNFSGNRSFDHAYAVDVLLQWDEQNGNHVHACMASSPQQNRAQVWQHLAKVIAGIGFEFKSGVMIGTRLEYSPDA